MQWLGIEASLRASLYFYNTYADADQFLQTTKEAVAFFQRVGF
jgi:selenocysteine lyase/cysteine desulfurase